MLLPFAKELARPPEVVEALNVLAYEGKEQRGAVFTLRPVVDAILDLVGYTSDCALHKMSLLEPSFGEGDFLLRAVGRLLDSYFAHGGEAKDADSLVDAVRAIEIHAPSFDKTRGRLLEQLLASGVPLASAETLVSHWLVRDDFLLHQINREFDVVVGNPPYVRQEKIPNALLKEYRALYKTMYDRADLYVPFYEKCLDLLTRGGRLGFICADRWVKNKYGGPLREKIAESFHLEYFIDMDGSDAFDKEVLAYPSITIIRRGETRATRIRNIGLSKHCRLEELVEVLRAKDTSGGYFVELDDVARQRDPWLLDAPQILRTIRELEQEFPTLEDAGCRVTIGVATGCDRVFLGDYASLPVEEERKLPLAMARDLQGGELVWSGGGIVNPFLASGKLAPLEEYPDFASYLQTHSTALKKRHVAKKNPKKWYRTIDRIHAWMTNAPKLLIPDIKGNTTVIYDEGRFYPHHNLYVVLSDEWELRALQTVLRSSIALMFVASYSVRMSGGFLRFQAQYLRRIRIPRWGSLSSEQRQALRDAAGEKSREAIDQIVFPLFGVHGARAEEIRAFALAAQARKKQ